jgi:uncharacterized protein YegP (UPF0339 family)
VQEGLDAISGKTIRTSSGAAAKEGRTNWSRVRGRSDEEIDTEISGDPDTYALESEVLGRADSSYHYVVYRLADGQFRWKLLSADRKAVASSPDSFRTKAAALNAIAEVRAALLGGNALAA